MHSYILLVSAYSAYCFIIVFVVYFCNWLNLNIIGFLSQKLMEISNRFIQETDYVGNGKRNKLNTDMVPAAAANRLDILSFSREQPTRTGVRFIHRARD
jgi:hypothetical protein